MVKFEILKVFSQYVGKSRRKVVWVEKKAILSRVFVLVNNKTFH